MYVRVFMVVFETVVVALKLLLSFFKLFSSLEKLAVSFISGFCFKK